MTSRQGANNIHPSEAGHPGHRHNSMEMHPSISTITNQPRSKITGGDKRTHEIPGYPSGTRGLDYLNVVDQLIVHQKVELAEVLCGCETRNKYTIKNSMGQPVYNAVEDTDCCNRNCCGPLRPFEMKIRDNNKTEVIRLYRELRCVNCCCPCCLQRLEVYAPPGNLVGVIAQEWSIMTPNFSVQTAEEETLFRIDGSVCPCSCCDDVNFPIYSEESGKIIGKITKQWSGLGREAFADADHFGISFPLELDAYKKATLLGALFLIDFMYFESNQK